MPQFPLDWLLRFAAVKLDAATPVEIQLIACEAALFAGVRSCIGVDKMRLCDLQVVIEGCLGALFACREWTIPSHCAPRSLIVTGGATPEVVVCYAGGDDIVTRGLSRAIQVIADGFADIQICVRPGCGRRFVSGATRSGTRRRDYCTHDCAQRVATERQRRRMLIALANDEHFFVPDS